MSDRTPLEVGSALSDAVSSMRSVPRPVIAFLIVIVVVQTVASIFLSDEILSGKGFQRSDWFVIGLRLLVESYFWCGLLFSAIQASRGAKPSSSSILPPFGVFLRSTIVILTVIPVWVVGLLLLIFPGVYLGLMWSQAYPLILDARSYLFDSLGMSSKLTKGVRGKIFLAFVVPGLLMMPAQIIERLSNELEFFSETFIGSLILLVVGLWQLLVIAFMEFLAAAIYKRLLDRADSTGNKL